MMKKLVFKTLKRKIHVSTYQIKPALPTHSSIKHYNLSPVDQFAPNNYIPIVFYYPNFKFSGTQEDMATRLKRSLSETLVQFYPFSGRMKSATRIDCNDEGVEFQQVKIQRQMDQLVSQESHSLVFPDGCIWGNVSSSAPLLVIRLANYICGGVSIAVCMSHKLGDAKSVCTFMTSWATKTHRVNSSNSNENRPEQLPHFICHPSTDNADITPEFQLFRKDWCKRRFLFPNSKLTKLKDIVSHKSGVEKITKFEVLTALLSKCTAAANTGSSGFFNPSTLLCTLNMRDTMLPPLPETSVGNYFGLVSIDINNESKTNVYTLVEKIKKQKMVLRGIKSVYDAKVMMSTVEKIKRGNYDFYFCSSLCNMQFYRVDFGWGNPSKVAIAEGLMNNGFVLMDTPKENGIEALVSLNEKSMAAFEQDKDILEFSSISL